MMKNLLRSKKIGIFLIVLAWLLVSMGINADAATFTASATGNWSAAATWTNANVNRTGTVSCSTVSTAVVGTGTLFTTELSVGSVIQRQNGTTIGTVASISDDTNLTLTGNAANTTSGSYRISDGPGGAIDDVTINNGITVTVNIANALCNTITTINTGGITISGTNSLTVTGLISMARPSSNSTNFTIAVGAGTLTAGSLTMSSTTTTRNNIISISTGAVTINGAVTTGTTGCQFNFTGAGILDFHGTFTSSPTITTFAGSTVIYSNAGIQTVRATTYRNLTISGSGTKTLAAATPTVSGVLTVKAGTTLALSSFALGGTTAPSSVVLEIGSTGSIISGTGALNLGGDIIVNNITGNSGATISCPVQLDADRTFTIANDGTTASDLTISGVISTSFGLTKDGAGLLALSGANTYTGSTTISTGVLNIQNDAALGTTAAGTTVSNLAALQIEGGITVAEAITLQSPGISSDGGIRNISGDNTLSGLITLSGSSYIASDADLLTLNVASGSAITGTYNLNFSGAGNTTVADPISTSSAILTKDGTGTLTLSATNTYAGTTTVNEGTLSFAAFGSNGFAGSNGNGTLVLGGGTLQYTGSTASTVQNITLTNGTASSIDVASGTTLTMSGANPASTGSLTKLGAGTLVLSGTSSFTGGTTITAGTLALGGADKLDNSGSIILSGGTLSTGASTGFSETVGTLDLAAHSTIALGTGVHTLTFANSSAEAWTSNTMLTITGWAGAYNGASSGTAGKIFIGSSVSGLSAIQLAQIQFFDGTSNNPAVILSSGEVVASREVPSGLSYTTPNTFIINTAITNLSPTVTGVVTLYGVSPALPAGLSLNTTTGVISGTPTIVAAAADYTVTASNSVGSTTFPIRITVVNTILTFYSRATGNWTANTTWSFTSGGGAVGAGIYPQAGDNVIVERTFTVTVNISNAECATLQVGSPNNSNYGILTFSGATPSLTVSGTTQVGGYGHTARTGTITFTSGSTLDAGSVIIGNAGATPAAGILTMTAGGTLKTGSFTVITVSGNTWTPGTGTVILDANNTLPSTIVTSFKNLTISAGITTMAVAIPTLSGTLTVNAGATLALSAFPLGATNSPTSVVMENGSTGSTISGTGAGILHLGGPVNVNYTSGSGTAATISCPINLDGNRTFTLADNGTSSTDMTISGIINNGSSTSSITKSGAGTMELSGNNTYSGGTTINAGTVSVSNINDASGDQNLGTGGITFANGGTLLTGPTSWSTAKSITLNIGGGVITMTGGSNSLTGSITGGGGLSCGGSDLVLNRGTGNNDIGAITVTSNRLFVNTIGSINSSSVEIQNGATIDFALNSATTVSNAMTFASGSCLASRGTAPLTITASTFPSAGTMIFNQDDLATTAITVNGAYPTLTGDLTIQVGGSNITVGTVTLSGAMSGDYSLSKTSTGTLSFGSQDVTFNNLTISGGTLISTSGTMNLAGDFTNNGIFTHNSGTVNFNGSLVQTIPVLNYYSISATNAAGVSLTGNTTLDGTLTLANGALTVGAHTLTFQNSNTPISRSAGTLTVTENSNLVFGTPGNTGGSAFAIPTGTFTSAPSLNNLTINRTNSLTWNNQMLSLKGILLCSNGTFNTNGNLTLLSTASQTALIDGAGSGSVTGNVSMQQYIASGFGYKYISSPFQAATVNELSDDLNLAATFATVYAYDEDNHSDSLGVARDATGWTKYITPSGILTPMKGFAANFGSASAAKTIAITGVVNNDLSSPLTLYNHNRQYTKGFNLVGNPYPSPIDWNASSGWTKTNIDDAVYYFDAGVSSQYTGTYSSYANGVSSNGTAGNIIPAMQGFFVHVTNGSYPVTAYLGMGNQVRVNNLSSVFHKSASADTKSLVRLTAEYDTEKIKDAAVVYFDELATTIFDKEFDALKLMNTDQGVPNLYSVTTETDRLSISAIPYPADSTTRIPLGLKTEKADWVTLNVPNIENIPSGLHIYLEDALTGLVQDMQINPEYRVHIEKGTLDSRFTLIFSDKDLVHAPTGTDTFFATLINGRLSVTLDANSGNQSQLLISNMPGQVMHRENLYGSGAHEIDTQLPAGIYVLTIYGQKGICSQKIYIPN